MNKIDDLSPVPEGSERPDPRLWRLDELPQSRGRPRWLIYASIALGIAILVGWVLLGLLTGAWGSGLVLGPVGAFILVWGVIQAILAAVSMESFDD